MRQLVFAVLIINLGAGGLSGQALPQDWRADGRLAAWAAKLPSGWTLALQDNLLIARGSQPIWVLAENKVNAPLSRETPGQRAARIRKFGQPTTASFTVRLAPLRPARLLWSNSKGPEFLSDAYEVYRGAAVGLENEMVSVDPPSVGAEVAAVAKALRECLVQPLRPGQDLADYEGQTIAILAKKTTEYSQHIVAGNASYPHSEYIDWGDVQLLAHTQKPLPGPGPWELIGRVVSVGKGPPEPGAKERVQEFQVLVDSVREW